MITGLRYYSYRYDGFRITFCASCGNFCHLGAASIPDSPASGTRGVPAAGLQEAHHFVRGLIWRHRILGLDPGVRTWQIRRPTTRQTLGRGSRVEDAGGTWPRRKGRTWTLLCGRIAGYHRDRLSCRGRIPRADTGLPGQRTRCRLPTVRARPGCREVVRMAGAAARACTPDLWCSAACNHSGIRYRAAGRWNSR